MLAIVFGAMALPAAAQFGPKPDTPRSAKEIYADRAMDSAASFLQTVAADALTEQDRADPDRANFWYAEALEAYTELCANSDSPRDAWSRNCYKLAGLYLRGQGTAQDYSTASDLLLKSCREGSHTDACLQQAYTDHTGNAGATDWPRARELYGRACDAGAPSGCAGLGNMLYRGQGGSTDRNQGADLLQETCAQGYEWSCERITGFGLTVRQLR